VIFGAKRGLSRAHLFKFFRVPCRAAANNKRNRNLDNPKPPRHGSQGLKCRHNLPKPIKIYSRKAKFRVYFLLGKKALRNVLWLHKSVAPVIS
jgi:hypothetical protein